MFFCATLKVFNDIPMVCVIAMVFSNLLLLSEISEFFGCDSINYLFLIKNLAIFILLFALNSSKRVFHVEILKACMRAMLVITERQIFTLNYTFSIWSNLSDFKNFIIKNWPDTTVLLSKMLWTLCRHHAKLHRKQAKVNRPKLSKKATI